MNAFRPTLEDICKELRELNRDELRRSRSEAQRQLEEARRAFRGGGPLYYAIWERAQAHEVLWQRLERADREK